MGIKIALFQGAFNNAGDYLIVDRTKKLIRHFYPDCEFAEFYRNESLEPHKEEINKSDIGIFAGGPSYFAEFYPDLAPFVSNLREIKIPLMFIGAGWFGDDIYPKLVYTDKFKYPQKKLLTRAINDSKILGCRDFYSTHVLRNNGFENVLMTGCPAWYDLDNLDKVTYEGPSFKDAKKICISDCGNPSNLNQLAQVLLLAREFFGKEKDILFVAHKTMDPEMESIVRDALDQLNIKYVDISGKLDGFKIYDDCDVHIGFRVHAHIYNLSVRNISILIEEDARGAGVNHALGLTHIPVLSAMVSEGKLEYVVNEHISNQLKDCLLDLDSCNYMQMQFAYQRMRGYFENMKQHILSIGEIVSKNPTA